MYLNDGGSKEIWVVGRGVSDWQVLGLSEVEKYGEGGTFHLE